jgi:hypothetical protein
MNKRIHISALNYIDYCLDIIKSINITMSQNFYTAIFNFIYQQNFECKFINHFIVGIIIKSPNLRKPRNCPYFVYIPIKKIF